VAIRGLIREVHLRTPQVGPFLELQESSFDSEVHLSLPAGLDRSGQREALESETRTSVGLPTGQKLTGTGQLPTAPAVARPTQRVAFTVSLTGLTDQHSKTSSGAGSAFKAGAYKTSEVAGSSSKLGSKKASCSATSTGHFDRAERTR